MLAEDIRQPRGIACITYNNERARELERRLEVFIDVTDKAPGAYTEP